jgi:hypothetical protein
VNEADPEGWRDGWRMPTLPDWGFESEPVGTNPGGKLRRGRLLGGTSWLTRFAVRGAADASVIPDAPSGFPHLNTIMLAERLSEMLPGLL